MYIYANTKHVKATLYNICVVQCVENHGLSCFSVNTLLHKTNHKFVFQFSHPCLSVWVGGGGALGEKKSYFY